METPTTQFNKTQNPMVKSYIFRELFSKLRPIFFFFLEANISIEPIVKR
jgi:hypothetical protein